MNENKNQNGTIAGGDKLSRCSVYADFVNRAKLLSETLLCQGYNVNIITSTEVLRPLSYEILKSMKTGSSGVTFDSVILSGINKEEIRRLLAKDSVPSHDGRFLVVGEYEAGKTTLVMNLIGGDITTERRSTDGIDVHFSKLLFDVQNETLLKSKSVILSGINKEEIRRLLAKDSVPSHDGRFLVVGEYEAGKTTLVMNLIGGDITTERRSTDGIDVYFSKLLFDVQNETLLKSKSGLHSFPHAIYQKVFSYVKQSNIQTVSDIQQQLKSQIFPETTMTEEGSSSDGSILESLQNKMLLFQSTNLDDLETMKYIPIPILDFAGQIVYYATHQTFITPNGIYIITLDGSRKMEDFEFKVSVNPGEKRTGSIIENIRLWISSILAYCCQTGNGYPKIVFVATHRDMIPVDELEDRRKFIMTSITDSIKDDEIKSHLVLDQLFFVNALARKDPEIKKLRDYLSRLLADNPQWGKQVPKQFLILEMMMASMVEEGKDVMTYKEVKQMNKQTGFEELSAEQLKIFLHIQYMNGKLTYLSTPELRNHVIINPTCLIDVLKSIVTIVPGFPEQSKGRLTKSSLQQILSLDKFKNLQPYKAYFQDLLIYYDVLAEMKRYDKESGNRIDVEEFIVPCMITKGADKSLVEEVLQSDKFIGFVFAFRGFAVPTALPNRLMASILSIWNVSLPHGSQELIFSDFLVVNVDRKHDLAIQVEKNDIRVYLIHKRKRELIIRDVASSVRECVEQNLTKISEVYPVAIDEEMKPQRTVPFDLKLRSRCCVQSPEDVFKIDSEYVCPHHGTKTPISELTIWYTDRTEIECPQDCPGVSDVVLQMLLNDTQLLRLCNSLTRDEVHCLALHLGVKHHKIESIEDEHSFKEMAKFYILRACREKNKRCGDFLRSMEPAEINTHTMCKILRQEEVTTELPDRILITKPSDEMLDKLSVRIGKEWMVFGLELGLEIASLEQIEYDNPRNLRETTRRMLSVWRNREDNPTIRDLVDALGRAGRNPDLISDILENCRSFPRIEPSD